MSNLLTPVDSQLLEAVTGGAAMPRRDAGAGSSDLLQQLTTLSTAIKDISNTASRTGFSSTEVLMLGLLMSQRSNSQINVFYRRSW